MKIKFTKDYWPKSMSVIEFVAAKGIPLNMPVTAVKIFDINQNGIMLVKAPKGWDIPGGHIEGDESPKAALVREIQEETGGLVKNAKLLGYLQISKTKSCKANRKYPDVSVIAMYGGSINGANTEALVRETVGIKRFRIESLPEVFGDGWSDLNSQITDYFCGLT